MTEDRPRRLLGVASVAVVIAGLAVPASAAQADTATDSAAADVPLSYVVNTGATDAKVAKAERAIRNAGAIVVQSWPQIGVVVAHSASSTFKADVVQGSDGRVIQSVGATRTAPLTAAESPIGVADEAAKTRAAADGFERRQGVSATKAATDPREAEQWDMAQIKADIASDGSRRVTVGVLDSGIDDTHPDLKPNLDVRNSVGCSRAGVPNRDRSAWIPTTSDHGTHVAGTIAAARNGVGIVGVAPKSRMASVKVVNDDGYIYPEYAICGFVWAAEHGFEVTNNSYYIDPWQFWCGDAEDQAAGKEAVRRAVAFSVKKGVVSAAAAGNSNYDLAHKTTDSGSPNDSTPITRTLTNECQDIPTELSGVVTVASNDRAGLKSSFSNFGYGSIDVAAPGSSVLSTVPGGYGLKSGTSMASPHAAGVLALLAASHPDATPAKLARMLNRQADDQPCPDDAKCTGDSRYNSFFGDGRVDAFDATGRT